MSRRTRIELALKLAFAALTCATLLTGCNRVAVPDCRDLDLGRATQEINMVGLQVGTVSYDPASTVEQGTVIGQDPLPGRRLPKDGKVNLTIAGPAPVVMPDLRGMKASEAGRMLAKLGLTLGQTRTEYTSDYPSGTISYQVPLPDMEVPGGEPVFLTVSQGPPPKLAPDVIGLPIGKAREILGQAGLVVLTFPVNSDAPADTVVSQNPDPTMVAPSGSKITLGISSGVQTVIVPNLQGVKIDTAIRRIRQLGLVPRVLYSEVDPGYGLPPGVVYSLTPGPDMTAVKGSDVWMYVWRPPAAAPAPKPSAPTSP